MTDAPDPNPPARNREYARYGRTFPEQADRRRCALLAKKFAGFTAAERVRRLDLDPAWRAEFARRVAANLTPAEESELAELTAVVDRWFEQAPWAVDQEAAHRRSEDELRRLFRAQGLPDPFPRGDR